MCENISTSDWIQIIIAGITLFGIFVSVAIAVVTLVQNYKVIRNNSRAHILFYIDYHPQINRYFLVIKNFGNDVGKLIKIEVTPKLDWSKCKFKQNLKPLTDVTNVLLAPKQKISSWFDFNEYPDKLFKVKLSYKTLNKIYTEEYQIDLSFINNKDWIHNYSFDDTSNDYKEVLYRINNSILELSQKD